MKYLFLLTALLLFSCKPTYHIGEPFEPMSVYSSREPDAVVVYVIYPGTKVASIKSTKGNYYVANSTFGGYVRKPHFRNYHSYRKVRDGDMVTYYLPFDNRDTSTWVRTVPDLTPAQTTTYAPSTYRHSTYKSRSRGSGSVHVKAYTRKDGTRVAAHNRSSPKRH